MKNKKTIINFIAFLMMTVGFNCVGFTLTGNQHKDVEPSHLLYESDGWLYDYSSADIGAWVNMGNAYLYDNSSFRVNEQNAIVNHVYAYGFTHASISIFGSEIRNIDSFDFSTITIYDGDGVRINAHGNSIVNVLISGEVSYLFAHENSIAFISDNSYVNNVWAYNTSKVNICGGGIQDTFKTYGNSNINITGGDLYSGVDAYDFSQVKISGGEVWAASIHGNSLNAYNNSCFIFEGINFAINGIKVANGHYYASDFVEGKITDSLINGDALSNQFKIYDNGSIVLIPEPTTISLIGLGLLALRRKK